MSKQIFTVFETQEDITVYGLKRKSNDKTQSKDIGIAGVDLKILTGDNIITATAIANEFWYIGCRYGKVRCQAV
jgi:hypothetical protein